MRSRIKEVSFYEPLYQANISYLVGGDVNDLISFIKERHKDAKMYSFGEQFEWTEDANTTNAYQFHVAAPLGKGEVFYVWMDALSAYLLFHETFHLTGDILWNRGIKYNMDSEEAFAYLGGYLFQEAFRLLKGTFKKK